MAIEDWITEFDDDFVDIPSQPECRDCGKPILWQRDMFSGKWRPMDGEAPHRCPKRYARPSEFPKLEGEQ